MRRSIRMAFFAGLVLAVVRAQALEIPLTGGSAGTGGGRIAFVDMEKIFQSYPETRAAKEDYMTQLQKKRDMLAEKERELWAMKTRVATLEQTLSDVSANTAQVSVDGATSTVVSTAAVSAQDQLLALMDARKEIQASQTEFEELKKRAADDLAAFENQQSQLILGKIYQALKDLAQEEQVMLVVDKTSILFGAVEVDLTEKLQQRVRGY